MRGGKGKQGNKAQETRRRIIDAAGTLFVEQGYEATKLQEIADRAGVAVQTISFVFRNKPSLLKELVDVAIAGDDEPMPTMDRPWFAEVMNAPTAESALAALVARTRRSPRWSAPRQRPTRRSESCGRIRQIRGTRSSLQRRSP